MIKLPKSFLQQSLKIYDYWIAGLCTIYGILLGWRTENSITKYIATNIFHRPFDDMANYFFYYAAIMIIMGIVSIVSVTNYNNRLRFVMATFIILYVIMTMITIMDSDMSAYTSLVPNIVVIISIFLRLIWVFHLDLSITDS